MADELVSRIEAATPTADVPHAPPLVERDDESAALDPMHHVRVLGRSAGIIAGLVVAVTIGATVSALRTPRVYRAEAMLMVAPRDPQVVDIQGMASEAVEDETRYLRTQYQVLKSRALAEQVIRDHGLRQEPLLGGRPAGPDTDWSRLDPGLVDRYLGNVDVEAVPGTRLIRVSYGSSDPDFAARMANAHVDAFVRQGLKSRTAHNQSGLQFLQARLGELKERLQASEAKLNEYRWQKGILVTDEKKENIVVEQLDDLNKQLSKAEGQRLAAEADLRTIEQHGVEALPELAKNTTFHELQVQVAMADGEHARMAALFKPNYPGVAELKRKADAIRAHLDTEIARVGDAVRSTYRAARDTEERLRTRFEEQKTQALQQKDAAVEYAILARDVDTNRALYESVLSRMKEMTVAVEVRASNVSVADRAVPPSSPAGAGRLRSIAFSALLAAIAGIVLAYLRDALDDSVKTVDEVERVSRLPSLGVVPQMSHHASGTAPSSLPRLLGAGRAADGPAIVLARDPRPALTDAYRQVRTSLLLSRPGGPPRTLLVTSGLDGEGKTLTAANLAVAFAQIAHSVLLIDADLRRPACHRLFGVANGPGLSELLTGQCTVDEALASVDGHALSVMPAGATPPNPTELLGSAEMRLLLAEASGRFDYVIVDGPASFAVADPLVLSTLVDGVVVVARRGRTRRRLLKKLRARYAYARAPLVGVVLNGGDDAEPSSAYYTTIDVTPHARPAARRATEAA
jgi:capsular exopolysaccharide synthesis family protein